MFTQQSSTSKLTLTVTLGWCQLLWPTSEFLSVCARSLFGDALTARSNIHKQNSCPSHSSMSPQLLGLSTAGKHSKDVEKSTIVRRATPSKMENGASRPQRAGLGIWQEFNIQTKNTHHTHTATDTQTYTERRKMNSKCVKPSFFPPRRGAI